MAKIYQANHFTGKQLDDFMNKVLDKSFAGQGLQLDTAGVLHALAPNYGKLLYSYTHTSNYEVHPESVNLATGEFVATAHGLTTGDAVYAVVQAPYHLYKPYEYLPGGLMLGPTAGGGSGQRYYVNVVDEDTFTLSTASGGAAVTYTEVNTMDLTKFHFEKFVWKSIVISDLPQSKELLLVCKGRLINFYRYIIPNNVDITAGTVGEVAFDSYTYCDGYSSIRLGAQGGWGSLYAMAEIKLLEDKHLALMVNEDSMSFRSDNRAVAFHSRKYFHFYATNDYFDKITLQNDGMLANGSTLEVYAK